MRHVKKMSYRNLFRQISGGLWSNAFLSNCSMIIHYMKEINEDLEQSHQSTENVSDYNKNYILGISSSSASKTQRWGGNFFSVGFKAFFTA